MDYVGQSGLAKKVEKPTRKLRKERKNRAKKVCSYLILSTLIRVNLISRPQVRGTAKAKAAEPPKKGK
jgi:small subunit ribosomal protein S24e